MRAWEFVAGSYFSYLFFPLFVLGVTYRGIWWLLPTALIMVVVPILDRLAGDDTALDNLILSKLQSWLLGVAPALFVVGQTVVIGFSAHNFTRLSMTEKPLAVLSVGMIGSIGITASHELVHKPRGLSKIFGRLGLANVCYLHFEINHIQGHHVRAGTEADQSTAWLGESLYQFVYRTVPGCLKASWDLERENLTRRGSPTLSRRNQMIQFAFFQTGFLGAFFYLGGTVGIAFFLLQAVVAVFMLESVSYIEHYGLMRDRRPDGKYEPMKPTNSWDCYGRFSSYLVFQLQRHADHHSYPTRHFANLRTATEAPKLPIGYPLLTVIAMVPPLWRKLMDTRVMSVRAANDHQLTRGE